MLAELSPFWRVSTIRVGFQTGLPISLDPTLPDGCQLKKSTLSIVTICQQLFLVRYRPSKYLPALSCKGPVDANSCLYCTIVDLIPVNRIPGRTDTVDIGGGSLTREKNVIKSDKGHSVSGPDNAAQFVMHFLSPRAKQYFRNGVYGCSSWSQLKCFTRMERKIELGWDILHSFR